MLLGGTTFGRRARSASEWKHCSQSSGTHKRRSDQQRKSVCTRRVIAMFALCAAVTRAHAQSGEIKLTAHDAAKSDAFGAAARRSVTPCRPLRFPCGAIGFFWRIDPTARRRYVLGRP